MIEAKKVDGKVKTSVGDATGNELIDELSAAYVAVIMSIAENHKDDKKTMTRLARYAFREVTFKTAVAIENKCGFNVLESVDHDD